MGKCYPNENKIQEFLAKFLDQEFYSKHIEGVIDKCQQTIANNSDYVME